MIQTKISLTSGGSVVGLFDPKVFLRDDGLLTLGQERMQELGEFAIKTVVDRTRKGIGSDDAAMPPLKISKRAGIQFKIHGQSRTILGYPQWKSNHGLQPKRDLFGTGKQGGHMLDALIVRSVSGSSVVMAIAQSGGSKSGTRVKALANEKRAPWLSFSPADERAITKFANDEIWPGVVKSINARSIFSLTGRKAA